ncbi:MAG: pyridoxal-phosphate dependent enzyme [Nitrososphaerota archaeon]
MFCRIHPRTERPWLSADFIIKVYGVQAEGAAPLPKSLMSGRAEDVGSPNTIADGIAATRVFDYMLPLFKKNLDDVFTVTDEEVNYPAPADGVFLRD